MPSMLAPGRAMIGSLQHGDATPPARAGAQQLPVTTALLFCDILNRDVIGHAFLPTPNITGETL